MIHPSPWVRAVLWLGGVLSLILAVLGVLLPGLPATPFVLLAGACFVRASPRAHAWLLRNRLFGPALADWERHHSIPRRIKRFAIGIMLISVSISILFFAGRPLLQAALAVCGLLGAAVVARIPTRS